MGQDRVILIVADDYGIGPETSRGILDVAKTGHLSATVLLVNTPTAESAVLAWRRAGEPLELGWHPNLTLDRPISEPGRVPSLVNRTGEFWKLNQFLVRASLGRIRAADVAMELQAQYDRFCYLVGHVPRLVNSHQHVAAFDPVGTILLSILDRQTPRPFFRRLGEPMTTLRRVPGARFKRLILTRRGRRLAQVSRRRGFPGCDVLAGITSPRCVFDEHFFSRWLDRVPGNSVELMCHPGYLDETLIDRDCPAGPGIWRRAREFEILHRPNFGTLVSLAGFRITGVDNFIARQATAA
jgi:predicted glycoside hydrolase/deacetylase ChbG (UPF0249 family)